MITKDLLQSRIRRKSIKTKYRIRSNDGWKNRWLIDNVYTKDELYPKSEIDSCYTIQNEDLDTGEKGIYG